MRGAVTAELGEGGGEGGLLIARELKRAQCDIDANLHTFCTNLHCTFYAFLFIDFQHKPIACAQNANYRDAIVDTEDD